MKKRIALMLGCTLSLLACVSCGQKEIEETKDSITAPVESTVSTETETKEEIVETEPTEETEAETVAEEDEKPADGEVVLNQELTDAGKQVMKELNLVEEDYNGSFEVDMDLDGENEAFVVILDHETWMEKLYYVDDSSVEEAFLSAYSFEAIDEISGYYFAEDDFAAFIYDTPSGLSCSEGAIFTLKNGKLTESYPEGTRSDCFKYFDENQDLVIFKDFYGMMVDLESSTQPINDGMWSGHCWLPYKFHYDAKERGFVEYKAEMIGYWEDLYPYSVSFDKFPEGNSRVYKIARENGELDLDFVIPYASLDSYYSECGYQFITQKYQLNEETKEYEFVREYEGYFNQYFDDGYIPDLMGNAYEIEGGTDFADYDRVKELMKNTVNVTALHYYMDYGKKDAIKGITPEAVLSITTEYLLSQGESELQCNEEDYKYYYEKKYFDEQEKKLFGITLSGTESTNSKYYYFGADGNPYVMVGDWGTEQPLMTIKDITCKDKAKGIYEVQVWYYVHSMEGSDRYSMYKKGVEGTFEITADQNATFGYIITDMNICEMK